MKFHNIFVCAVVCLLSFNAFSTESVHGLQPLQTYQLAAKYSHSEGNHHTFKIYGHDALFIKSGDKVIKKLSGSCEGRHEVNIDFSQNTSAKPNTKYRTGLQYINYMSKKTRSELTIMFLGESHKFTLGRGEKITVMIGPYGTSCDNDPISRGA